MAGEVVQLEKGAFVDFIERPVERLEVPMPSRWFVLRAHPGRETKVLKTLRRRGISCSFPMYPRQETVVRRRSGYEVRMKRTVVTPLFPGMIFVPDFECSAGVFDDIEGLSGFLHFGDWRAYLTPKDYAEVQAINAVACTPHSKRERMFATGELVRVVDGPFASFSGRIERLDSKGRLSVLVDLFKRMIPVQFNEGQLEPV